MQSESKRVVCVQKMVKAEHMMVSRVHVPPQKLSLRERGSRIVRVKGGWLQGELLEALLHGLPECRLTLHDGDSKVRRGYIVRLRVQVQVANEDSVTGVQCEVDYAVETNVPII